MASSFRRVRGVLPKRSNLTGEPSQAQFRALSRIGDAHIREHRKTVSAWQHEAPSFGKSIDTQGSLTTLLVFATGTEVALLKYVWIDRGTDPHDIFPKNPNGRLVFNAPYFPSTEPRVIGSRQASRGTDQFVARGVHHPGIEPRRFSETINENLSEHDARLIQEAGVKL